MAQVPVPVERNLPSAVSGKGGGLRYGRGPAADADDTPLGVDLKGIRLIGLTARVMPDPPAGITSSGVEGLDRQRIADALGPLLGQFQEITAGVPQLRVRVVDGTAAGGLIEAERISEDLDWLNRFPYRQFNGVFEPGSAPGFLRLSGSSRPSYASHTGRIVIPTVARQALSLPPRFVATSQDSAGRLYATRGYTLNDGSVDAGFVLRNEMRLQPFAALGRLGDPGIGPVENAVSPFAFLDRRWPIWSPCPMAAAASASPWRSAAGWSRWRWTTACEA
ncbi:hypothetical protein VY88_30590 [Azospirillum thiophilum]|uniref:Haemolysin activator HlyB C-terminal domain-containing protein n=1 Tax=Azospirillum thiophilum TaxID=528244 RepID=A0AAC8W3T0_9PROT|nr:hypothetical protein AL072_26495 [Azospirillum thiophilum]KJR61738.1 hypothetical protein VY88_30590 [Azospirillum thiophilum]